MPTEEPAENLRTKLFLITVGFCRAQTNVKMGEKNLEFCTRIVSQELEISFSILKKQNPEIVDIYKKSMRNS